MTAFEDLSLLRAFVCIVESGSISAGARRLKIPQPTMSRYLRALEEQCNAALLRRDTHHMSLTETGHRLLVDAQAILSLAEDATQRLQDDQTTLRGHLRLFSTIDSGQFTITRLVSSFLQINPHVTAELAFTNRPAHMIQEGCDVGILPGRLMDESVVARPAGAIALYLAASPAFVQGRLPVKALADLKAWPWIGLSGIQFWESKKVTLFGPRRAEQSLSISPILISEGVTSIREAVRGGLGVAVLPDWLIREDILSGRLVRVLPQWNAKDLPVHVVYAGNRLLPVRVRAFVDFAVSYMTKALGPKRTPPPVKG
ncbi:MAG: LysR family transcriptional regulator [Chthoniobacter sp.]